MTEHPIQSALERLEAGQLAMRADLYASLERLEAGQARLRTDLMARMDRLQGRVDSLDEHLTMGLGHSDRVERQSHAVADQNRLLAEQLNTLMKIVRRLEGRINELEERR